MIDFWLLAGLLALAALFFLWWPLLMQRRRGQVGSVSRQELNIQAFESQTADLDVELQSGRIEQAQYEALKTELQRNLLGDVSKDVSTQDSATQSPPAQISKQPGKTHGLTALLLSLAVVLGGLGLYLKLGSSATLQQMAAQQSLAQQLAALPAPQRLVLLEKQAQLHPDRTDVWYTLANVYFQQQRFEESIAAYEQLLSLVGDQPGLLAEYAQALFFIKGNRVTSKVKALAERTLRLQPGNVSALGLTGIDAFERKRYAQAIAAWQAALKVAPDAQGANALRQGIARAKQLLDQEPQSTQGARLTLQVSLDEALRSQVNPELSVFVLARAVNGPPMPLAVQRLQVKDLPREVILSDDMAMTPELKLSSVAEVEVLARVSFSGQPLPAKGDLQGSFRPVNVSSQKRPISLVIDQIIQ